MVLSIIPRIVEAGVVDSPLPSNLGKFIDTADLAVRVKHVGKNHPNSDGTGKSVCCGFALLSAESGLDLILGNLRYVKRQKLCSQCVYPFLNQTGASYGVPASR
jgi:hypothetical protein